MTIVYHDNWEIKKGLKDSKRHQKKIDDAIRKNVKGVIGEESIITTDGKQKVRIPVKGLKNWEFKHGSEGGGGIGQGEGKPGDIIGERQKQGGQGNQGGQGHGPGDMEVEVDIGYLIDVMFEDLGLPWLDPKKKNAIEVSKGWKFESVSKKGVFSRLHKKRTMLEAIKRSVLYVNEIKDQTGCDEDSAKKALFKAKGDLPEAIRIIKDNEVNGEVASGFLIQDDDLRFKQIDEDTEICSKAVVFALMDVSASMTIEKKYLMKSLLFWMVNWLRKQYESVEIRFIQHTDRALEVDEGTFFGGGETGGTVASTAFKLTNDIIDNEYPIDEWNIYAIYCSDGEDFEPVDAVSKIEDMIDKKINMFSYVEIKPYSSVYSDSDLLQRIKAKWKFEKSDKEGRFLKNEEKHFLLSIIKDKTHIWASLKHMLGIKTGEKST